MGLMKEDLDRNGCIGNTIHEFTRNNTKQGPSFVLFRVNCGSLFFFIRSR